MTHLMIDAMGVNSHNIPLTTPTVGAYVTGWGDVPWTAEQIARFHNSAIVRIDQNNDPNPRIGTAFDLEANAGTVAHAIEWCLHKIEAGAMPVVYIQRSLLPLLEDGLHMSAITKYWIWLADWNLSEAEAEHALTPRIRAIQFASPSSNPNTLVPGSHLTLSQAGCDLSVCADDFFPPPVQLQRPHGIANAGVHADLHTGHWAITPEPGHIALGRGGSGRWDVEPLPAEGDHWCAKVRINRGV